MPRSLVSVYIHLVWATWDRQPLISQAMVQPIHACLVHECRELRCELIAAGGIEDHLHALVRIPSTVTLADLVKMLKGSSSHLANGFMEARGDFRWQGSYGAFSVSPHDLDRVRAYLQRQREHHAAGDLWSEWEQSAEFGDP